ncbi:MAG: hypothetical protein OQK04_01690 [Kangiellaceae bacterium]|nr:hypothetical protein [Kangiellaceae bacterium]MCW8997415.1 hypothetical protein [Kangiellaceae bacterium]
MRKFLLILSTLIMTASFSIELSAHTLKETTARVIVRDGQIEIRIQADINRWVKAFYNNQAWLVGDIDEVLSLKASQSQKLNFLKKQLKSHTKVQVRGKSISLAVARFPNRLDSNHGHFAEIVLTGKFHTDSPSKLSVRFPKTLGPVYTSLVKPQYLMLTEGKKGTFQF